MTALSEVPKLGAAMSERAALRVVSSAEIAAVLGIEKLDSLVLVGTAIDGGPAISIRAIEPFTWAWLGVKLAEGVVAWIGGKLFQEAFFADASNNQVIEALSRKIDEAVQKLQKYIDDHYEWEVVDRAQRDLTSIYRLLREYTNAPHPGDGRLNTINHDANQLWDFLYNRREAAFIPACLAASLKVAALHTIFKETKKKGDRQNVLEFLDLAISAIESWKNQIYNHNHIFELTAPPSASCQDNPEYIPNPKGPGVGSEIAVRRIEHHWTCHTSFRANGREFSYPSPDMSLHDDAFNSVMQRASADYNQWVQRRDVIEPYIHDNLMLPAEAILTHFREARKALQSQP